MGKPEVVNVNPTTAGYRLIAEQYRHEVLQAVNREKGKRKGISERMRAFGEICAHLAVHDPFEYEKLINTNPFASKTRISWEELKSLR